MSAIATFHLDDVSREMVEGRMVCENKVFVDGQTETVAYFSHDFGLLHRIDTQLAFEVLVHFNEILGVPRVVHDDRDEHTFDVRVATGCRGLHGRGWIGDGR